MFEIKYISEIKEIIQRCKNGEYDGADLMRLWCFAESLIESNDLLVERSDQVVEVSFLDDGAVTLCRHLDGKSIGESLGVRFDSEPTGDELLKEMKKLINSK